MCVCVCVRAVHRRLIDVYSTHNHEVKNEMKFIEMKIDSQ